MPRARRSSKNASARSAVHMGIHLEPRPRQRRNAAQRIDRFRLPEPDELGFGLFQRRMGYPAQFHYRVQLQHPGRQGSAIWRQYAQGRGLVLGGWHANGVLTLRTGAAYSLSGISCQGVWSHCGPDIVSGYTANQAPAGGRTPQEWFDINAYAVAAPLTGGDLGLQAMTGPPTKTMDFSMFKEFPSRNALISSSATEAINLATMPVLSAPDANLADAKALRRQREFR